MSDRVTVKIPRALYVRLQEVVEASGYRSVNEFVVLVLREFLTTRDVEEKGELTPHEVERIREYLRHL